MFRLFILFERVDVVCQQMSRKCKYSRYLFALPLDRASTETPERLNWSTILIESNTFKNNWTLDIDEANKILKCFYNNTILFHNSCSKSNEY